MHVGYYMYMHVGGLTLKQVKKGGCLENVLYALSEGIDVTCLTCKIKNKKTSLLDHND